MDMFKPGVMLFTEPDGEYTLHASALVPMSGYVGAGIKPGVAPANIKLTPETFPILLLLRQHDSPGFQIPHMRTWEVSNQNLSGKTHVLAFVCLVRENAPETVLGSASAPISAAFTLPTKEIAALGSEWHAQQRHVS